MIVWLNNFRNYKKTFSLIIVFLCCIFSVKAQFETITDTVTPGKASYFSLLTASPGKEVWSQYGHTGIRYKDPDDNIDIVFNYGLFDFSSPHFIWRFVTGHTDYMVGACPYYDFILEYEMTNRSVTEQILNLTPAEKACLLKALLINIQPENRLYRYNFLYNNCATKPRDMITRAIHGKVIYNWNGKFSSVRDEVHSFTNNYQWAQFGIDFALGSEADDSASLKVQQFAPDVLMESFSKAVIKDSAGIKPLVSNTFHPVTVNSEISGNKSWLPDPLLVFWLILAITIYLSIREIKAKKTFHWLNAVLYTLAGLVGFIIAFLVFFSEHPTTDVNYLLLWLHPFYIIYVPALLNKKFRKDWANRLSAINFPLQAFALAGTLILPQSLHPAMYPLLLTMMLRSSTGFYILKKEHQNE